MSGLLYFKLCLLLIASSTIGVHGNGDSMFGKHVGGEVCEKDDKDCKDKEHCWGYEDGCSESSRWYVKPECNDEQDYQRFNSIDEKMHKFWMQADFGYIKHIKDNLKTVCEPQDKEDSSFVCSHDMGFCHAKNIYMDLRSDGRPLETRLEENPFKPGQLGGYCQYNSSPMKNANAHRMSLSSWIVEIERYSSLPFHPINDGHCDVIVDKPTYFMKLDAIVNMYHHFCDFFNLYLTFHVNGSFSRDINIVLWEGYKRNSLGNFGATWKAFTDNPIMYLGETFKDKRVCFKDAIFALLPRMIFGLFYNTPLIPGCFKTGLFKAFNRFLMERLEIKQERNLTDLNQPIRIGLLSRGTAYRKILNEKEIEFALENFTGTKFQVLKYNWNMPFLEQIKTSHNTDIFLGMHGAGLTHMLFLPDWAAVFEIYNCGDEHCYKDLARLRGVNYYTWKDQGKVIEKTENKHEKYGDNMKFRNYAFDVKEFMKIVSKAMEQVKKNLQEYKGG